MTFSQPAGSQIFTLIQALIAFILLKMVPSGSRKRRRSGQSIRQVRRHTHRRVYSVDDSEAASEKRTKKSEGTDYLDM